VGASLGVAIVLMFAGAMATWFGLGESPEQAKMRKYKEARYELTDPTTATREQSAIEADLTAHEKGLLGPVIGSRR